MFLSVSLALSCLDVIIKDYYLSLRPRLRVLVPPCCVHRDRRPDPTVSGAHSPRFVFLFSKVFCFVPVCLFCLSRQGSRHSSFRRSPRQVGVGVRRDRRECRESAGREPSSPPITGDIRRRPRLTQPAVPSSPSPREISPLSVAHQGPCSREITPPSAAHPGPPFVGDHAAGRLKPAGPPLTPSQVPWI